MDDAPLGPNQIAQMRRDAMDLVAIAFIGNRGAGPGGLQSLAQYDQLTAEIKASGLEEVEKSVWARWPKREGMLAGTAISILISVIDEVIGAENTQAVLARIARHLEANEDPFNLGNDGE